MKGFVPVICFRLKENKKNTVVTVYNESVFRLFQHSGISAPKHLRSWTFLCCSHGLDKDLGHDVAGEEKADLLFCCNG